MYALIFRTWEKDFLPSVEGKQPIKAKVYDDKGGFTVFFYEGPIPYNIKKTAKKMGVCDVQWALTEFKVYLPDNVPAPA